MAFLQDALKALSSFESEFAATQSYMFGTTIERAHNAFCKVFLVAAEKIIHRIYDKRGFVLLYKLQL